MQNKSIFLLCLLIIATALSSCNNMSNETTQRSTEIDYAFPLQENDIVDAISILGLDFSLTSIEGEEQSVAQISQEAPHFRNLVVASLAPKQIHTRWSFEDTSKEALLKDYTTELKKIMQLTCHLYGNTEFLDTLYSYIDSYKDSEQDFNFKWATRHKDNHVYVCIKANERKGTANKWDMVGFIQIFKTEIYGQIYAHRITTLQNRELYGRFTSVVNTNQLKEQIGKDDFENVSFIVHGNLTNINKMELLPEALEENHLVYANYENYHTAALNDVYGSIEVYIEPNTFNEEELLETRDYHVFKHYNGQDTVFFIRDVVN